MLTHNLGGGGIAYNGQRITFLCTIVEYREDIIMEWSSEQYIGTGGDVLQLTSDHPIGYTANDTWNPTTVATLISTSTRRSNVVVTVTVVSELQLIASARYPISNVSCGANGRGPVSTVTFQTILFPGKPA